MFLNFSLCPGGAMMMHESVAEFDPNMAVIQPEPDVEPEVMKAETETAYCPISKTLAKIGPMFDVSQKLATMTLNPDSNEEAVANLEYISKTASEFAEKMRFCLIKQDAIYQYVNRYEDGWCYEAIKNNLGFFMKNAHRLISQGYGRVTVQLEDLPALDIWSVNRALGAYIESNDELPSYPFDIGRLFDIVNYDKTNNVFDTTEDLLKCLLFDHDRVVRLSVTRTEIHDLDNLIRRCSSSNQFNGTVACANDSVVCGLVAYMSRTLRMIKTKAYQLQCDLMNEVPMDTRHMQATVRQLVSGTINLLYLPAVYMLAVSFRMKNLIDTKNAMEQYVNQTMKCYETP